MEQGGQPDIVSPPPALFWRLDAPVSFPASFPQAAKAAIIDPHNIRLTALFHFRFLHKN